MSGWGGPDEGGERLEQAARAGVAGIERPADGSSEVGAYQPIEIRGVDEAPGCVVGQLQIGLGTDVAQRPDRDLDGLRRTRRRTPLLLGDRRGLAAGPRSRPLVHDVPDDLDPVAGSEQGTQRPGLVAEHPALEPQPLANGAMEELARPRCVEHQPGVGDQRLAAGLADVGPVVLRGDPGVHPVRPDPLSDDGQGIGRHGGAVQRGDARRAASGRRCRGTSATRRARAGARGCAQRRPRRSLRHGPTRSADHDPPATGPGRRCRRWRHRPRRCTRWSGPSCRGRSRAHARSNRLRSSTGSGR